uniref:Intraflagellar transport protein 80 homolog (inferred by orthology to a human protein) n=1 Tax=Nippostrongylus brasiliensis TaxID=27835 RepID=A0A0N4Y602_NIPBR
MLAAELELVVQKGKITPILATFMKTRVLVCPRQIHFINKMGRIEKSVQAHKGAALEVRWSSDGTGLLSGEDGAVKLWSRNGMLRSVVAQMSNSVYCASFDSTSDNVLYLNLDHCYMKSLKKQAPPLKWKAHDGLVLCCHWSQVSEYIVTGGEDCKFKLWDSFGRNLFSSISHEFPITSVAWSPDGQCFAVGSYNILLLCDKAGWTHSLEKLSSTGSLLSLCWFDDATQLVGGSGSGQVIHAQIMENTQIYEKVEVVQLKRNVLEVRDVGSDLSRELLETRDRISRFAIAHDHLLVITATQLLIYSSKNWNTPVIIDLKERIITIIKQSSKVFLLSDGHILYVYSYDGRNLSEIKLPDGKQGLINEKASSLSNDTVAIVDRGESTLISLFDPNTAKSQGDGKINHEHEIVELTLSQCGQINDRLLAFRDSGANVFIAKVRTLGTSQRIVRIGSSIQHLQFNDVTNMLAGIGDGRIVIWPAVVLAFVDINLLQRSVIENAVNGIGKYPVLRSFTGSTITLRRSDGPVVTVLVPPFASTLLRHVEQSKWDQALRLCRQVKSGNIWATLAGLATSAKHLYTSEIAYGVLEEVEYNFHVGSSCSHCILLLIEKAAMLTEARKQPNREVAYAKIALLAGKVAELNALVSKQFNTKPGN